MLGGSWGILAGAGICQGIRVLGRGAGGCNGGVLWVLGMLWMLRVLWMLGMLWVLEILGVLWVLRILQVLEVVQVLGLGLLVHMTDLLFYLQRQRW